jgi:hypothetical protein
MYRARRTFFVALLTLCSASLATAQLPQTRIYSIFPPGAQAGQTLDVAVTNGADLDELDQMIFSHPGIKATHKTGNTFSVVVAANVPTGVYECRAHGLYGTSNPRAFVIGSLPEIQEADASNTREGALEVKLNSVVNGKTGGAADVDYYKFAAKKGQRVLIECTALRIDSKFQGDISVFTSAGKRLARSVARLRRFDPMLDVTVPADGDYLIRATDFVYAGSNDYIYRLKIHTGPHIDFVSPAMGVAGTTSKYTIYGRNLPGSQPAEIASDGRQLQKLDVQIALPNNVGKLEPGLPAFALESGLDGASYTFKGATGTSNAVTIALAPQAAGIEKEPNNEPAQSQKITVPAEVTGQFQVRGDLDYYEFEAKAGSVYWIEVFAGRLGRQTDPYFKLEQVTKKEDGTETLKLLTTLDDDATNAIPKLFETLNDDMSYRFAVPADGSYRITLRDRYFEARGAPNLQYHLAVREEAPDFRVAVLSPAPLLNAAAGFQTWAIGLRRGENLHVQVAAIRSHGFKGAIELTATGLPAGVTCKGATIPENLTKVDLIFTAAENAKPLTQAIQINAKARIQDPAKVKAVTTAEATSKTASAAIAGLVKNVTATVKPLADADAKRKAAQTKATADAAALKKALDAKTAIDAKVVATQAAEKTATVAHKAASDALTAANTAAKAATTALAAAKVALDKDKENQGLKDAFAAAGKANTDNQAKVKTATATVATALAALNAAKKNTATNVAAQKTVVAAFTKATATNTASTKVLATAVTAHTAAAAKSKQATDAKTKGDAAVVAATKGIADAKKARDAAAKDITRPARTATVVWNGTNALAAVSRVTRNLTVSVMDEDAPYSLNTDVFKVNISQNQQVIVPLKLAKRTGFDNKITLNAQNLPKNVKFEKKADIDKGKNESVARFTFPANVAAGTYTVFIQAQGQVAYQRNLKKLARAKVAKEAADKAVKPATDSAKAMTAAATKANTALTTAANALKAAQTAQTAAKKKLTDSQAAEKKSLDAKTAADKAVADAQAKVVAAVAALDVATKALAADKENADLKTKLTAATAAKTAADAVVTKAQATAKTATDNLTKTQAVTKAATVDATAKDAVVVTATATVATATAAKTTADTAKKTADDASKAATAAKVAADKVFTAATNASKAKNTNWYPPSTPIIVKVTTGGYFTITSTVPGGGNLKKGQKLDIKVVVKRAKGFTGPVTVALDLPPGTKGVGATPITIPADKTEGNLIVTAAGDAAEGAVQYLALRGTGDMNGSKVGADQAITVKVTK